MMVKALLILGFLATALLISRGKPGVARLALMRLGAMLILAVGVAAVLRPAWVTATANAIGVGRGTDLVLYLLVVAFLLTTVALYRKLHELEERYVDLARHFALSEASAAREGSEAALDQVS